MAWIGVALDLLLNVLKFFFGTDRPATTDVTNAKPVKPLGARSDDDCLRDLGVKPRLGTGPQNGEKAS